MFSAFTTVFHVRGYELREDGRIGHATFVQWFEEAAIQASAALGYDLAKYHALNAAWVIRDLDVEFLDSPRYGEPVEVTTWVSDFRRIRSHREYQARRANGGELLARGRAEWIFLDLQTMRPRRLSPEMVASFETNSIPALEPMDWPAFESGESLGQWEATRCVQNYEIDQMQHVNNVVYLNWIEQHAREAWVAWERDPAALRLRRHYIQFRQAAQDGDLLRVVTDTARVAGSVIWRHQILRGDTLLVEARSVDQTSLQPSRVAV
ncbi:MAG: hypothetical protein HY782_08590 [Chloroflexi bacterium]|nr:hypothetical protein [Chloroflexota bacterium]